jgi:hypothetical protein
MTEPHWKQKEKVLSYIVLSPLFDGGFTLLREERKTKITLKE